MINENRSEQPVRRVVERNKPDDLRAIVEILTLIVPEGACAIFEKIVLEKFRTDSKSFEGKVSTSDPSRSRTINR